MQQGQGRQAQAEAEAASWTARREIVTFERKVVIVSALILAILAVWAWGAA